MAIFDRDPWWQPRSALYMLKTALNPVRINYFRERLHGRQGGTALEVGCGGGILSEEIAALGFTTTGIDPSAAALQVAADHAKAGGLSIGYLQAVGENLPFPDNSFDVAFCCDVLEHVQDQTRTVAEIARVLKPGGIFCYDTINRTLASWLVAIGVLQKWKRWAVMPPELHTWNKFIKPEELKMLLEKSHLGWREHRGIKPATSPIRTLSYLRRRARGEWNYKDLALRLQLIEGRCTKVMYMGYAVKDTMPLRLERKGV
ncbi:SAM-dependent methyltransferase, type 11 [Geotalea daltonii FRC-32]|uniref:SAM-dependent methyltransferase, type 11 n=1 Tax=Geotalea daltonii (strain DSM 22248 / JCM 15807 / FRC-32) TaxID=316067 RepID=B9M2E9_GEODF|nr:bifunctional 2-polyprenyl-6-hydroxyphenol methylase/3-demethylubiquinol 3-O-methyltransferase UbiG [Geotalea daltonii]ACM19328.1 SAM-dependent methyltransferase, type 11 [Geotalea daltonii FRC-32]